MKKPTLTMLDINLLCNCVNILISDGYIFDYPQLNVDNVSDLLDKMKEIKSGYHIVTNPNQSLIDEYKRMIETNNEVIKNSDNASVKLAYHEQSRIYQQFITKLEGVGND